MWVKFLNIMKHVWRNPVVQFACFTLLDWVTFMFHRSTKHKFNKKKKYDGCSQDYSIGTSHKKTPKFNPKKKSSTTKVEVEQQKSIRKQPKKIVDKVEAKKIPPYKIANKISKIFHPHTKLFLIF